MDELINEIVFAARQSFLELFKNNENYYYCSLVTTGEGLAPIVSAWSWQALERMSKKHPEIKNYKELIKWSYSDSPYFNYGEQYFSKVKEIFNERPSIENANNQDWDKELNFRLHCMEIAMMILDKDGVFQKNQPRQEVCILVEMMPPNEITTEIALRLNKAEFIKDWLEEAAE